MSAYRFVFAKVTTKNFRQTMTRSCYDFSAAEISEFLSSIVEKYDNVKYYFNGRKKVRLCAVSKLVQASNGASSVRFRGETFSSLARYVNVQNLRNMFAILAYHKVPMRIHGKEYLVNYDNGMDVKEWAQDNMFPFQDVYNKLFNCGEVLKQKDLLFFTAI